MRESLTRKVEFVSNVAIIVMVCLSCVVLTRLFLFGVPSRQPHVSQSPAPAGLSAPDGQTAAPGTHLSVTGVDWSLRDRTILLVLSTQCHYCTDSAPFYKRLSAEIQKRSHRPRLIAVLPQEPSEGKQYLSTLGVAVDAVIQATLRSAGVRGTPTIMLVDRNGTVQNVWIGRLAPEREQEVMGHL